jgi:hypothetical protein
MNALTSGPGEPAYQPHPDILSTVLPERETVLLSLATSHYYTLNETGGRIWSTLEIRATASEIAHALAEEYDVTHDQAIAHAHAFIAELTREGLVVPAT